MTLAPHDQVTLDRITGIMPDLLGTGGTISLGQAGDLRVLDGCQQPQADPKGLDTMEGCLT